MRSIPDEISPYNIQLSPDDAPGTIHVEGLTQDSADRTSELLMVNHVRYHTLFDAVGFHSKTSMCHAMPSVSPHAHLNPRPHSAPSAHALGVGGIIGRDPGHVRSQQALPSPDEVPPRVSSRRQDERPRLLQVVHWQPRLLRGLRTVLPRRDRRQGRPSRRQ